ncbi:MAG: translation initiation factor 1 [Planctomycetota bacterium]|jgi:translation initiation factor 1
MKGSGRDNGGLVYSTQHGKLCPRCERPLAGCICARMDEAIPAGDGFVRIARESKGRKGAGVTLVSGVPLGAKDLAAFAKLLKKRCGTGGTIKDSTIEIQGDQRTKIAAEVEKKGWKVKLVGG